LSSRELGLFDLPVSAADQVEDLACDVALDAPDRFELRQDVCDAPRHVLLRSRVALL
jgi:hypothetical protein